MIEFKARRLEFEGIEDMDNVNLYIDLEGGVGKCVGQVRNYTAEQDPEKLLVRVEFVFTRDWLEKKLEESDDREV